MNEQDDEAARALRSRPEPACQAASGEFRALMDTVIDAQSRIAGCTDTSSILRATAREAQRVTGSEAVFVSLLEDGRLLIREVWVKSNEMCMSRPWALSPTDSLAARAIRSRRAEKWARGYGTVDYMDEAARLVISSSWRNVAVPLTSDEDAIGAITFSYIDDALFGPDMILAAEMLARTAATALRNVEGHRASIVRAEHRSQERIAMQLHDSAIQSLCALQAKVAEILRQPGLTLEATSSLRELETLMQEINGELREAIFAEPPDAVLDHGCIADDLDSEIQRHLEAGGVPVHLVRDEVPLHLPNEVCAVAKVLVREGLSNVRKHAHATSVMVGLAIRRSVVTVYVRDDGVGLDDQTEKKTHSGLHFGLANLKRITEEAGGELTAADNEDEPGMTLRARIRLKDGEGR